MELHTKNANSETDSRCVAAVLLYEIQMVDTRGTDSCMTLFCEPSTIS